MGLPGDRHVALAGKRNDSKTEQKVNAKPDDQEHNQPWLAQQHRQWRCRHAIGRLIIPSEGAKRTAALNRKKIRNRSGPNRRATGVPKASSQTPLKPRCMRLPWMKA